MKNIFKNVNLNFYYFFNGKLKNIIVIYISGVNLWPLRLLISGCCVGLGVLGFIISVNYVDKILSREGQGGLRQ